jgi:hypothetical protein
MGGMDGEERDAFYYCIDEVKKNKPSLSLSESIGECIDLGMFLIGSEGELRVNKDYFNGKNK